MRAKIENYFYASIRRISIQLVVRKVTTVILLTPTLGTNVPKLGFFGPEVDGQTHWERIYEFLPFTKYQNISGAPAITLPCATDSNGMPIGIQLASRLGADRLVLELSLQLESNSNWRKLFEI